jgi:hypothetical protein
MSFVQKNTFNRDTAPELCDKIREVTDLMVAQHPNNKFGVLFNAYSEKSQAKDVKDIFDGYTIQADSGGLQMQTLAHGNISDEAKADIYKTQAKYSTIAMSFDEIPIRIVGNRAGVLDMSTKYFAPDLIESCAKESGRNLAKQIEFFIEEKTTTKPLMIIQGNCMDTYNKWTEIIIKQIPQDHWKYIAGISSSSFSLGNGFKEDVERAFTLYQLPVPDRMKKHIHLLGVGAMNRLIPAIQFRRSGLFTEDMLFSYDSTKHTGGCIRGQYQQDASIVQMSRNRDLRYQKAWKNISKFSKDVLKYDIDEDDFYMVVCQGNPAWTEKYGSNTVRMFERNMAIWCFFMYSVNENMKAIEHMIKDEHYISKIAKVKFDLIHSLSSVKSLVDYQYWTSHAGRALPSKSVQTPGSSLDLFF